MSNRYIKGMAAKRKYPVGIQSFGSIREDGYLYVDKTPLIYKMITEGKPYFLSRPRRFGKSLLISTLDAVFSGRRELFEAFTTDYGIEQPQLYIARTDWRWEKYPVLRFDFSAGELTTIEQLDTLIDSTLKRYEKEYGISPDVADANIRMANLMRTLHQQTGKRVVVLVDEYDNFILHALGDEQRVTTARQRFQNLFGPLKAEDDHLQFAFITGISKFSQMGIFSKLNQLNNISMQSQYETICGISEEELLTQMRPDIEMMGQREGISFDEQLAELKRMYDGYHFSEEKTDIYNPFSLVKAFSSGKLSDYWFASGTPGAVINLLANLPPLEMRDVDAVRCEASAFDQSFDSYVSPLPILYQSGYLTIKDYDKELDEYTLGFPNLEVSKGFADCLYQHVMHRQKINDKDKSQLFRAYKIFRRDDELPPLVDAIKAFFAGIPYQLSDKEKARDEHYYHALLYTLFMAFGADVTAEESSAKGRSDIVLRMPKGIYILEIKLDKPAETALRQIDDRDYAGKYRLDSRPLTKVALCFSSQERNVVEWQSQSVGK